MWIDMAQDCVSIYVTEYLVHISRNSISMRTNITSSTRVRFRRLNCSAAQRTLLIVALQHGKQQSAQTPTQVKALLWYCWWPSKSRAVSDCIRVVNLEDLIENGELTARKSSIRLVFHERHCCPFHQTSFSRFYGRRRGSSNAWIVTRENF